MIKRIGPMGLLFLGCIILPVFLRADWKSDLNLMLKENDYKQALSLLETTLKEMESADRQEALALLPFIYSKNNLPDEEKKALIDYFEEFGDSQPLLSFLDFSVFNQALEYWGKWRQEYPLITNFNFLMPVSAEDRTIPEVLRVSFDLSTDAYYKIQLDGNPLEGGLWMRGFHFIQLPLPFYFDRPYSLNLDIFLKTNHITIRKRLVLEFKVEKRNLKNQELLVQRQDSAPVKNLEGELAFYIGDTLIYKSIKYLQQKIPVKITIPSPNPPGTKPYLVPQKDQYVSPGVSIVDAISAIAGLIKNWREKPPEKTPPTFTKKAEINFSFANPEKQEILTEVTVRLKPEKAIFLPY